LSGESEENHELIMKYQEVVTPVGFCHTVVLIGLIVNIFVSTFHCSLNTTVFSPQLTPSYSQTHFPLLWFFIIFSNDLSDVEVPYFLCFRKRRDIIFPAIVS
jgi:hypothetical protein